MTLLWSTGAVRASRGKSEALMVCSWKHIHIEEALNGNMNYGVTTAAALQATIAETPLTQSRRAGWVYDIPPLSVRRRRIRTSGCATNLKQEQSYMWAGIRPPCRLADTEPTSDAEESR